jgi:hypothetical protein
LFLRYPTKTPPSAVNTWRQCIEEGIPFLVDQRLPEWVEVTAANITSQGRSLVRNCRRMLRFNAEQLWQNLIRQGWRRVPPQW